MHYIHYTGACSEHNRSISISQSLLLALPCECDNNISKKDNIIVKEALFEFLNKSKRII